MEEPNKNGENAGKDNEGLRALLAKHNNDAMVVVAELYSQTFNLREDRRQLKEKLKELETRVPEGGVVLTAEQAKHWEAYKGLGKPEQITEQLSTAKQQAREAKITRLAAAEGLNEKVLKRLLGDADITVEEGAEGKAPVFKVGSEKEQKTIQELVEGDWKDFAPSLAGARQNGKPAVGQDGTRKPAETDYVGKYLSQVQPPANKEA